MTIDILDSTLRDGAQGGGISFSLDDKYKIAQTLGQLGVTYIEAGNPASNPKDREFFAVDRDLIGGAHIVAFGSTRRKGNSAEEDDGLKQLLSANTGTVCIFGKCSIFHVEKILNTTREVNLSMIYDTISYCVQNGRHVIFDAEHFYDGYKLDAEYAMQCLEAAYDAGAEVLCLCDTNGSTYYTDVFDITKKVVRAFDCRIGIHCHDDIGLATANTLAAVDAGARHIQGTFLGFGERCGNANLVELIATLQLKRGFECIPDENMPLLTPVAKRIAEITNLVLPASTPYVGAGAFAHKGGMHAYAVNKQPESYEHIPPETVGNSRRILLSEVSGKASIMSKIRLIAPDMDKRSAEVAEVLSELKRKENEGFQFEAAEASLELIIRRILGIEKSYYKIEFFRTIGEHPKVADTSAYAIIKVEVNGEHEVTAAEGQGPVNALDIALRRALEKFYPSVGDIRLTDYKVRVLESDATTAATVRVLIESTDGVNKWSTVGVSYDVLDASLMALCDSIDYKLTTDSLKNNR